MTGTDRKLRCKHMSKRFFSMPSTRPAFVDALTPRYRDRPCVDGHSYAWSRAAGHTCREYYECAIALLSNSYAKRVMQSVYVKVTTGIDAPLLPRDPGQPIPLTNSQLRLWNFVEREQSGASERLVHIAVRLHGPVDIDLLRRCIEELVLRHQSLRTTIRTENGLPRQHIQNVPRWRWQLIDMSGVSPDQVTEQLERLATTLFLEKLELAVGPVLTATLCKLPCGDHFLIIAIDHMVTDMMSNTILQNELLTLYRQGQQGQAFALPKLRLQFGDYAIWLQQTHDAWMYANETYWRDKLRDAPSIDLPFESQNSDTRSPCCAIAEIQFGNSVSDRLREIARMSRTSLALVVFAVYVAAMSRWLQRDDLLIRFISHARFRPELTTMVGFLANWLHLRMQVREHDSFLDLLRRADAELQSAYEHRDFDRVLHFMPECTTPLYFNWTPSMRSARAREVTAGTTPLHMETCQLRVPLPAPFLLFLADGPIGIGATLWHRADLFAPGRVAELGRNLQLFAARFAEDPSARVTSVVTADQ